MASSSTASVSTPYRPETTQTHRSEKTDKEKEKRDREREEKDIGRGDGLFLIPFREMESFFLTFIDIV